MQLLSLVFALLAIASADIVVNNYCEHTFPSQRLNEYPLKHLTVIIRHGDRTPIPGHCWEKSPEWHCNMFHQERPAKHVGDSRLHNRVYLAGRNLNPGNCSSGQLTVKGYDQQVKNGQYLRNLYKDAIVPDLNPAYVYLRSTDVPRTFLSAQGLLYGLFPPTANAPCLSQYVDIHTMDNARDTMTPNAKQCPRLTTIKNKLVKSPAYKKYLEETLYPLETAISQALDRKNPISDNIDDIFDCVQAHACHQFPLNQGLYNELVKQTDVSYTKLSLENDTNGFNYAQIAMGKFISEFVERIEDAASGKSKENMALFSGHDTTLFPLLLAFGINKGWPPYASMMRIELVKGPTTDLVVAYYNNELLVIPGCPSHYCPLNTFRNITQHIASADKFCERDKLQRRKGFGRFHTLPEFDLE